MPIPYTCPSCGTQGRVADALAGKKARCKNCGGTIRIDDPNADDFGVEPETVDAVPVDADDNGGYAHAMPADDEEPGQGRAVDAIPSAPSYTDADDLLADDDSDAGRSSSDSYGPAPVPPSSSAMDGGRRTYDDEPPMDAYESARTEASVLPEGAQRVGPTDSEVIAKVGNTWNVIGDPNVDDSDDDNAPPIVTPWTADRGDDAPAPTPGGSAGGGINANDLINTSPQRSYAAGGKRGVVTGKGVAAPLGTPGKGERNCPNCGQVIGVKAKKCRFCEFELSFEHLLTGERVGLDVNQMRNNEAAGIVAEVTKPRRSVPRIIGAVAVLIAFALPWLVALQVPGLNTGPFSEPTDLNGIDFISALLDPNVIPTPQPVPIDPADPDAAAAAEAAADAAQLVTPPDTIPVILREDGASSRTLATLATIALPLIALIVLLWELARGGSSIILAALPLLAGLVLVVLLGGDFGSFGPGLFAVLGGALLTVIPPLGSSSDS